MWGGRGSYIQKLAFYYSLLSLFLFFFFLSLSFDYMVDVETGFFHNISGWKGFVFGDDFNSETLVLEAS